MDDPNEIVVEVPRRLLDQRQSDLVGQDFTEKAIALDVALMTATPFPAIGERAAGLYDEDRPIRYENRHRVMNRRRGQGASWTASKISLRFTTGRNERKGFPAARQDLRCAPPRSSISALARGQPRWTSPHPNHVVAPLTSGKAAPVLLDRSQARLVDLPSQR